MGVEEALAGDADAVAICTGTDTHAELVAAAARAGKAIFCEKPVSLDLAEVDAALAAVEAAGVPFQIGFNRRFDPAHQSVHDAVVSGAVGEPHLVRISSRDPAPPPLAYVQVSGGIFLDMTIHDFDMARYVTGSEVVEVFARGAVRIDAGFAAAGDVDTALVTLVHASGCLTAIDNSRQAAYGYDQRVEVHGSAGMAASEDPLAHTGGGADRDGDAQRAVPALLPRALHPELRARLGGVPRGGRRRDADAGLRGRRPRAARDRARGLALAARGTAGGRRRAGGGAAMRILLTGASGFVGSNLAHVFARRGADVVAPSHAALDLTDGAATLRAVRATAPDAVVHAAILNDPAAMAADRRAAWAAYVGATRHVVDAANAAAAHVVLVSTDWVFDGTQAPAREDAPPNPVNQYGFLKAASELVVGERAERGTVARIAGVQGAHRARPALPRRSGRTASATSSPRWPGRCGAASRSRSGRTSGSTCTRRRRSRPARAT